MSKINAVHYLHFLTTSTSFSKMKTRQSEAERRKKKQELKKKERESPQKKEKDVKKRREIRRKKKIREELLQQEVLVLSRRVEKLEKALKRLQEEEEESPIGEDLISGIAPQTEDLQEDAETVDEELEEEKFEKAREMVERFLLDEEKTKDLTSLSVSEFNALVEESSSTLEMTTWRGKRRQSIFTSSPTPSSTFIFITLLWLRHYPTIGFLSAIFFLHPRTCTRLLKRTISALARVMKGEIQFPSDSEMESLRYTFFQPNGLARCVCVVDGTEIQISRPAKKSFSSRVYSGKKKQHSLNVMVITKLNGEIVYYSPLRVGAHDQSHWNELDLRKKFENKEFGILGDGGFTFNREHDDVKIIGNAPHKKPRGGQLTTEQKNWNRNLSQVRVVVENAIRVIKTYKILAGVFRHWRYGRGQIKGKHILTVCVTLANRRIKKTPLRSEDWMSPSWRVLQREHRAVTTNGADQTEEMSTDE